MNVKALQRTDRWVGVPLCWMLTGWRRLFDRRTTRAPAGSLLIVKLAEQGSTVLAYPALRRAVEVFGRQNVWFVAFEDNRFILDALNVIPPENVLTVSVDGVAPFLRSLWRVVRAARKRRFNAAVDLEFFSRGSAALTYLSGARSRVGFHAFFGSGPYRGDLMTHRLIYNPHLHTTQTFLSQIEALFHDARVLPTFSYVPPDQADDVPMITPTEAEVAEVRRLLPVLGEARPVVLLNPNASDLVPLRRWPSERYVELARRLLAGDRELVVAFTGAPSEAEAAAKLAAAVDSPRCVSLAGHTTLRQLLVLYSMADVLVTNDSGPAHFATLTPIHVVTLFGPETPRLFAARTPRNTVLWAALACSPCVSAFNNRVSPCHDAQCMQAISVAAVEDAVTGALRERRRTAAAPAGITRDAG